MKSCCPKLGNTISLDKKCADRLMISLVKQSADQKKKNMKTNNATLMETYRKMVEQTKGALRVKQWVEANTAKWWKHSAKQGLSVQNHKISIKHHEDEASYRKAKAQWMKQWRQVAFARHLHHSGPSPEPPPVEGNFPQGEVPCWCWCWCLQAVKLHRS